MFLTPTSYIKRRLARNFCKMQSDGRYNYNLSDRSVINNKPHIILRSVSPALVAQPRYMTMADLFGQPPPTLEEGDDETC